VPVDQLSSTQQAALLKVVGDAYCYCGCPHTLSGCVREHKACRHAPRMAAVAVRLAAANLPPQEILKTLTAYYASFEKRARLDTKDFGPAFGDPAAPVAVVEFSDFACPYCKLVKPELERLVKESGGKVRLYYKPFPLAQHPHADEAAAAGEWARDQGKLWPMYDLLFANARALAPEDLAGYARQVGGDPADLKSALDTGRYKPRIAASMTEARAAGLPGTPTLYLNGRRYLLPDYSSAGLRFTVEDEEEWAKHGGWAKD
jgi:protein-disulfide isomerase